MTTNSTPPCYEWGNEADDWVYTPCNPSSAFSMCCRTYQIAGASAPDSCLPNGLCSYFGHEVSGLNTQTFWIERCSDPSWNDPACATLKKYMDTSSGTGCFRDSVGNINLGFCESTMTYCCNQNEQNTSCCDTSVSGNILVHLPIASMIPVTTSFGGTIYTTALPTLLSTSTAAVPTSSGSRGSSGSSSVTSASSGFQTDSSTQSVSGNSKGLSAGAGAGIGVGAVAGALLIGLGLYWVLSKRRQSGRVEHPFGADNDAGITESDTIKELPHNFVAEVEGQRTHEIG